MSVPYDIFTNAFLGKITEYELAFMLDDDAKAEIVSGYMARAISSFKKVCKYDLLGSKNDEEACFDIDISPDDLDDIADIISEGMVVQWLKPYLYNQEILENAINTRDFTTYSPAELLMRIGNAYKSAQKDFIQMIREYSYNTGDLTDLHI